MSEMVERLAKVLAETAPWADGQLLPIDTEQFVPAVRAVLLAMREPTSAMVSYAGAPGRDEADEIWRDMIDEALKD